MADSTQVQNISDAKPQGGLRHWLSKLRSYLLWDPLIWFYTILLGSYSLLASFFDRDGRIQHGVARQWSRMILGTIGVGVQVEGLEKIDISKGHIYAVNHLSALDIPVLYAHLPFQFTILAKKELFRYPFLGWHLGRSGQIPVDLDNTRSFVRSLSRAAVSSLQGNVSVMIFPEGGRSENGQLQKFMGGAFYLAIKSQVDVVPMAIVGSYEVLPMNSFHIQPRPVRLLAGDPIPTTGLTLRDLDALTERARAAIAALYYPNASVPDLRDQNQPKQEPQK